MTLPDSHPLAHPEVPDGIDPPPPVPARRDDGLPAWPPWAPLVAFLGAILVALVASVVLVVGVEASGTDVDPSDTPPGITIGATIAQGLGLIVFAVVLARMTAGRASPRDFGFRATPLKAAVGWTVAAWLTFIVFSAIWAAALGIEESDDLPQELGAEDSTLALIAVTVMVTLLAPISEELFFRGFAFTALRRWIGLIPGALLTGVIFGGIHAGGTEPEFLVPLMVFGVVLCLLYWKTGSLLPPMVLHALNNCLALGVSLEWPVWAVALTMLVASGLIVAGGLALSRRTAPPVALPAA